VSIIIDNDISALFSRLLSTEIKPYSRASALEWRYEAVIFLLRRVSIFTSKRISPIRQKWAPEHDLPFDQVIRAMNQNLSSGSVSKESFIA
jgi:hypothetical protein